jgi:hypothetical protein
VYFGWWEFARKRRIGKQMSASELTMIIEFAPLVFGTAVLLAIFLFFSVEEH